MNEFLTSRSSYKFRDEFVVDNEDKGFSSFSISRESKLKQYIDSRKKKEEGLLYQSLNEWWTPSRWTPVAHSAYYGETIRSAMAIRKGDGTNHVNWSTILPEKGFYDLYVYIPVSAMYKRPSRRRSGAAAQGDRGDRTGREEAVSDLSLQIRAPITTTPSRPVRELKKSYINWITRKMAGTGWVLFISRPIRFPSG